VYQSKGVNGDGYKKSRKCEEIQAAELLLQAGSLSADQEI
jgi:hypothetical protein